MHLLPLSSLKLYPPPDSSCFILIRIPTSSHRWHLFLVIPLQARFSLLVIYNSLDKPRGYDATPSRLLVYFPSSARRPVAIQYPSGIHYFANFCITSIPFPYYGYQQSRRRLACDDYVSLSFRLFLGPRLQAARFLSPLSDVNGSSHRKRITRNIRGHAAAVICCVFILI
ncbi:hypothetical protein M011DRAFT_117644 [Sporormia fimetaria CBS 119925]|uniref:Uncharacterized protein n=1 Tax=Sporormia fimetaria CBS 119925 TaxID=1340428 RepID=A0A6A6VP46_9PLEO|nr:hypothetical protein M011DRAFT_117644 [Sporormia fimetaria CBS 119925]